MSAEYTDSLLALFLVSTNSWGEIFGSLAAKSSTVFSLSNFVSLLFGAEQEVHSGFLELKQPPAAAENTTLSATREAGQIKISVIATLTCHLRIL